MNTLRRIFKLHKKIVAAVSAIVVIITIAFFSSRREKRIQLSADIRTRALITVRRMMEVYEYLNNIKDDEGKYPDPSSVENCGKWMEEIPPKYRAIGLSRTWLSGPIGTDGAETFMDPFLAEKNGHICRSFGYASMGDWFVIIGRGPDCVFETEWIREIKSSNLSIDYMYVRNHINMVDYDPTNGLSSRGDLFFTSQNIGFNITTESIKRYRPDLIEWWSDGRLKRN